MDEEMRGQLMGVLPIVAQCGILAFLMLTDRDDKGDQ